MAISILADETTDLEWDAEAHEFIAPRTPPIGPIFTIRPVDYWHANTHAVDLGATDKDKKAANREAITNAIEWSLVAIDGDKATANRFKLAPGIRVTIPLFNAIWAHTLGN